MSLGLVATAVSLALGLSVAVLGTALMTPVRVRFAVFQVQAVSRPFTPPPIPDRWRPNITELTQGNLTLRVYAGITTAGIHLASRTALAAEFSRPVYYRETGTQPWRQAHPLTGRITKSLPQADGSYLYEPLELYVTSLFWLQPATHYDVCVHLAGADCNAAGNLNLAFITQQATNQPTPEAFFTPTRTVVVDPTPDRADFTTIQAAVDDPRTGPGTRIQINPGTYRETVTLTATKSGAPNHWLQLYGMPGAILEGRAANSNEEVFAPSSAWEHVILENTVNGDHLYRRQARGDYYALWIAGEHLLRHRDSDRGDGWKNFLDASAGEFRDDCDDPKYRMTRSWYMDKRENVIYLRLDRDVDPGTLDLAFAKYPHGIRLDAANWVWIEGLTIQHFGNQQFGTAGIYVENGNFNIIRRNTIGPTADGVRIVWSDRNENCGTSACSGDDGAAYNRVEGNEITSGIPEAALSYCQTKRAAAYVGIQLGGSVGNVATGNALHHIGENGIQVALSGDLARKTGCDDEQSCRDFFPYVLWETDVADNAIERNVEGLEPDGGQVVNARFFRNRLSNIQLYLVSLQAAQYGPTWVVRNVWQRETNELFTRTEPLKIKYPWMHRYAYLYHNDVRVNHGTGDAGQTRAFEVKGYFRNIRAVFRNNIFQTKSSAIANFDDRLSAAEQPYRAVPDVDFNNWSQADGDPHVYWITADGTWQKITSPAALCADQGLECHGQAGAGFWDSGLTDPAQDDFTLQPRSGNLDTAQKIPGITFPYYGVGPDIGALELASFKRGDANGDGKLDASDAVTTLRYAYAGAAAPACLDAADYNDDGKLNLSDAIATLRYLFQGTGSGPADPSESCGYDLTQDLLRCESFPPCLQWGRE